MVGIRPYTFRQGSERDFIPDIESSARESSGTAAVHLKVGNCWDFLISIECLFLFVTYTGRDKNETIKPNDTLLAPNALRLIFSFH